MIITYETVDGTELDRITVDDGTPEYWTGRARAVVEQAIHRCGSLEAAIEDLAGGWSNGYVVTRSAAE